MIWVWYVLHGHEWLGESSGKKPWLISGVTGFLPNIYPEERGNVFAAPIAAVNFCNVFKFLRPLLFQGGSKKWRIIILLAYSYKPNEPTT